MHVRILLLVLVFLRTCLASSQSTQSDSYRFQLGANKAPKREFRAFWIVTLDNKDFPSRPGLSTEEQKAELIEILDYHQSRGMNAVIFQVRPSADALYASKMEPWSEWLSGKQGVSPQPFYDPLEFMIEQCHKRNMELHAWFNPFRAVYSIEQSDLAYNHISKQKPHWFLTYGKQQQFNPGIPEVRQYIAQVIMDVVKRYDIDGVQFDDYFYPYKIYGQEFPDEPTYRMYAGGSRDKSDWRRDNINQLIRMIHENIKKEKPHVKFGISPLGVWRNKSEDPRGSATSVGQSSYDYLAADVLKWLQEGWIDYIAPQLYWSIGHERADYLTLADWWANNSYGRHLYIGQATYKIGADNDRKWFDANQLPNQLRWNRSKPAILGSIFFRAKNFMDNEMAISDTLGQYFYNYPALIPTMPWIDHQAPAPPSGLKMVSTKKRIVLRWENPDETLARNEVKYYVVYRFKLDEKTDLNNPRNIVSIQQEKLYFEQRDTQLQYIYAVTAVDRLHNESEPVFIRHKEL
ncbi:MAG: family 10 glycosylhydrolase [Microscillaceae bacterium]|nr:family 10 glycosylhydrolase [Microscillaceae bacterium]